MRRKQRVRRPKTLLDLKKKKIAVGDKLLDLKFIHRQTKDDHSSVTLPIRSRPQGTTAVQGIRQAFTIAATEKANWRNDRLQKLSVTTSPQKHRRRASTNSRTIHKHEHESKHSNTRRHSVAHVRSKEPIRRQGADNGTSQPEEAIIATPEAIIHVNAAALGKVEPIVAFLYPSPVNRIDSQTFKDVSSVSTGSSPVIEQSQFIMPSNCHHKHKRQRSTQVSQVSPSFKRRRLLGSPVMDKTSQVVDFSQSLTLSGSGSKVGYCSDKSTQTAIDLTSQFIYNRTQPQTPSQEKHYSSGELFV